MSVKLLHQIRKDSVSALDTVLTGLMISLGMCRAADLDPANYVDPRIGNISQLLVLTFPTFQQPNQMFQIHPIRDDYTFDQVQYFPLQIISHRGKDILQMRVSLGAVNFAGWKRKMAYDHDLEVVHPWLYETYLIEHAIMSPVFTEVAIDVPGGQFKIAAPASSKVNKYIQKARLNGKPLNTPFITHEQIMTGGTLTLELGPKPNKQWGVQGVYLFEEIKEVQTRILRE